MIDKNDVKMPVPRKDVDLKNEGKVRQIEELLRLVNEADNKQELRLKEDYYKKFYWFGSDIGRNSDKRYFSYQEEAVYDFVFNLNKSGILSDQVGMGKTIEAGMIISELASRNELRSLLIIVPNEILAQKWEYELETKFGIKEYVRNNEVFPTVKALKNMDDFYRCIFDCVANEKFVEYKECDFKHTYKSNQSEQPDSEKLIASFIDQDIRKAVELINNGLAIYDMPQVVFDGSSFSISGTKYRKEYKYDANGSIYNFVRGKIMMKMENINTTHFAKGYRKILKQELDPLFIMIGDYFSSIPGEISAVAESMSKNNPILVIPIAYSEYQGDNVKLQDFLNKVIFDEMRSFKHKYNVKTKDNKIEPVYEEYRVVDFFIDVGYQTLIVDEVHDYIDVASRMERSAFHKNDGYQQFPSNEYNRYELFDDYYFIKKQSLYKKLKSLADKATRKIFLTATPIKSDMVDFYLLTLLASNKDSEAYRHIFEELNLGLRNGIFKSTEEIENAIEKLYNAFRMCVGEESPKHFCENPSRFLKEEKRDASSSGSDNRSARYLYPYFNNTFLRTHLNDPESVADYLESHVAYMSVEEIIMELVLAYNAETKTSNNIANVFKELQDLLDESYATELQTRVVFRAVLNNTIKQRFEEDFTKEDGKPIKRIRELLEIKDGARKWHKTYRKYGIRHTRHQTYNLSGCSDLDKLNKGKMERFRNLPIWPRRDGKVIYLMRDDSFFDCFIDVRRELPNKAKSTISINDLPNIDKMTGDDAVKAERFDNAIRIFDYINDSMSGGDPVNHLPQFNKYDSVDINDAKMVDYKLALVNKLMDGSDPKLGTINKKVLLFAEEGRETILEWFRYQQLRPLYNDKFVLDPKKQQLYKEKWDSYGIDRIGNEWRVSDNTEDLNKYDGNLLIIIDPKRYEKGVDLQKADTIINFDINYDPLKMEQRIGRIDRIRPSSNNSQINIISFVSLNDMSGFVINFFAYELKMFTQWMGETTGIVSVPDENNDSAKGHQVSFSGKVYELEKYYNDLYRLCRDKVEKPEIERMANDFVKLFSSVDNKKGANNRSAINKYRVGYDFEFLQAMRESFDTIFRNSISPQRAGYTVDRSNKRVMRFNSSNGVFLSCGAESCDGCPSKQHCRSNPARRRNISRDFVGAIKRFFNDGERFYNATIKNYQDLLSKGIISGGADKETQSMLVSRLEKFKSEKTKVNKLLTELPDTETSFTIPISKYNEIFNPIKELYWDAVAASYIKRILDQFYKQCDSVLGSAALFENFIKILSIADFMNNMEGNT